MGDCPNLTWLSCRYCTQFDHATEDCPILLANIRKKGVQPQQLTQNLHMLRAEPCEEDPKVNIVLRSGATTGEDNGK